MDSTLRVVPANPSKSVSTAGTANSFGLHDSLAYGPRTFASEIKTVSALQHRLEKWDETQDNLRLNLHRNVYGVGAPMMMLMERKLVSYNPHMPAFPRSNVHLDVLRGTDESLDVADFMNLEAGPSMDIHAEMERKLKM
ncbi:proteasome maturation factor UMP1 [Vararia minispora EC-137]|uniref:Proteasome maturation factor UMP1 n=1 Tax=Vararia minispora EC-137 TaxID=1314806 RepID=A0ACB8QUK4_9AGAM|nr:proteasome maturation factor UMP1 [Vararia minispora EC-137]